ncbi:hypothetical protein [Lentzea sp. CC55]|uniref:hypothetical protein n=1 Tax=Lentzea sp. CC55 TaxID=2884909 RepID=UPI0035B12D74
MTRSRTVRSTSAASSRSTPAGSSAIRAARSAPAALADLSSATRLSTSPPGAVASTAHLRPDRGLGVGVRREQRRDLLAAQLDLVQRLQRPDSARATR